MPSHEGIFYLLHILEPTYQQDDFPMLTISDNQIRAFERMVPETFRPLMVQHLTDNFFEKAQFLGRSGMEAVIEDGIIRGQEQDLTFRYEYCLYIDLMMKLGSGFINDPQLAWVRDLIMSKGMTTTTLEKLSEQVSAYEAEVLEAEEVFPAPTFQFFIGLEYDALSTSLEAISQEEFSAMLEQTWPKKHQSLSTGVFDDLFEIAKDKAMGYTIHSKQGVLYFILLMFMLGHDFDRDKQYIWISNLLNDPKYNEERYKLSSLHFTVQKMFEALLEEVATEVE